MTTKASTRAPTVRERWAAVLGEKNLHKRVAHVLGRSGAQFYRWEELGWPSFAVLLLEVIEVVPRKHWPASLTDLVNEAKGM